ncbi:MAG: GNAT family N-acetyltransferase [Clostridia bacterium]|nr:GNAT family N-acetyltransferase [Clostridia bacterium]
MKRERICQIFSDLPRLQTERLLLRRMLVSDAEDMFRYAEREDVTTYLLWSPHPTKGYTADYLRYLQGRYSLGEFYDWAVVEKESGRMIGTCGFTRFDFPHNCAEIGYVLNPDYHGRGYGTEAAARILRFGFEVLELHRIEAKFMQGNEASLHVMEKLGMTFEGYRRDGMLVKQAYRTIGVCSILRHEFESTDHERDLRL